MTIDGYELCDVRLATRAQLEHAGIRRTLTL